MKPRIFIGIHYMHLGGAETSLLGLLQALDTSKVDVDLFVYSHEGELMKLIPEGINLLPEDPTWSMFEKPLKEVLIKGYIRMFLARMWAKVRMKKYITLIYLILLEKGILRKFETGTINGLIMTIPTKLQ